MSQISTRQLNEVQTVIAQTRSLVPGVDPSMWFLIAVGNGAVFVNWICQVPRMEAVLFAHVPGGLPCALECKGMCTFEPHPLERPVFSSGVPSPTRVR